MSKPPKFGVAYKIDGRNAYRVVESVNVIAPRPTPSYTAPKWAPHADTYLKDGTPCYSSNRSAKRSARAMGYVERTED